ncbi:MAG: hypothetical protein IPJ22_10360 [Bacteroidetes bacterium]|nr:hypothetical protein [Bacteroidota bacterium]
MSRKYKFNDNEKLYFISFAVVGCIEFLAKQYYSGEKGRIEIIQIDPIIVIW